MAGDMKIARESMKDIEIDEGQGQEGGEEGGEEPRGEEIREIKEKILSSERPFKKIKGARKNESTKRSRKEKETVYGFPEYDIDLFVFKGDYTDRFLLSLLKERIEEEEERLKEEKRKIETFEETLRERGL